MKDRKPKLERRLQLATRVRVEAMLYRGWTIMNRDPLQLFKGRQIATIDGGEVNYMNL